MGTDDGLKVRIRNDDSTRGCTGWLQTALTLGVLLTALALNVVFLSTSVDVLAAPLFLGRTKTSTAAAFSATAQSTQVLLGMLTVPRPVSYLPLALNSLLQETGTLDSTTEHLAVVVSNLRPQQHSSFTTLSKDTRYASFSFRETIARPVQTNVSWQGLWGVVPGRVYQLNVDLLDFLSDLHWDCMTNNLRYVFLAEDDFVWCPLALRHVFRAVRLAVNRTQDDFLALRTSYGNNGLLLHCRDLLLLVTLGERTKHLGPLDSIFGQVLTDAALAQTGKDDTAFAAHMPASWRGRAYLTYRHNLMEHVGHMSARLTTTYGKDHSDSTAPTHATAPMQEASLTGGAANVDRDDDDGSNANAVSRRLVQTALPPTVAQQQSFPDHTATTTSEPGAHRRAPTLDELRGSRGRLCYPQCFAPIQYVGLMPAENFADGCLASGDDLSPCVCGTGLCRGMPFPALIDRVQLLTHQNLC